MKIYLLISILILLASPALGQSPAEPPTITVSGQAEIMVVPDEIVFRLVADNVAADLETAKKQTDADVKKVFALARRYDVESRNIQTDYVQVNKRYNSPNQSGVRTLRGYGVSQTIVVLLKNIPKFEAFLSDVLKEGITEVGDVTFRVSQVRKHMDQARALAIRAAREKAIAMAGELGQVIGNARNVTEVGTNVSSAYHIDDDQYSNSNTSNFSSVSSSEITRNTSDTDTTIAPGMVSITARVRVSFELK